MSTKPTDVPTFADSVTGLARRVDPGSGIRDDGYAPGDRPAAQHLDFWLGLLGAWCQYVNDQAFQGTFSADTLGGTTGVVGGYVQTGGPAILHATRTDRYGASQMDALSTWVHDTATSTMFLAASGGTGEIYCDLPVLAGDRIRAVRVVVQAAGGAVADVTAKLEKIVAVSGSVSPTNSTLVSTVNSIANPNIQTITLTPASPEDIGAGMMYAVRIHGANTAGNKYVYRVELDTDRIA